VLLQGPQWIIQDMVTDFALGIRRYRLYQLVSLASRSGNCIFIDGKFRVLCHDRQAHIVTSLQSGVSLET
jgi:hypothetical protein